MKHIRYLIATVAMVLFFLFVIYEGYFIVVSVFSHLPVYQWLFYGIMVYVAFYLFISSPMRGLQKYTPWLYQKLVILKGNLNIMEVDTHEHAHVFFGFIFFRKISTIHVEEKSGFMRGTSGSSILNPILTLAPYCLPLEVYALLIARHIVHPPQYWIIDIVIGFVLAYYLTSFIKSTGNHQSDIKEYPLWFSYVFIVTLLTFSIVLLLCAMLTQGHTKALNFFGAFGYLAEQFFKDINQLLHF